MAIENLSSGQNWIWICLFCLPNFWKNYLCGLKNTFFFLVVFQTALLLSKKLILYQVNHSNGLTLMECTKLIMLPIILKQLT